MKAEPKPLAYRITAIAVTGSTFFYFLIFAQFSFLHRLSQIETNENLIEIAMLAMGIGGVAGSIYTGRRFRLESAQTWLIRGFVGCGLAGAGAIMTGSIWTQIGIALAVGLLLASLTVSIVPLIRALIPEKRIGIDTGIAVGGAYFLSNIPIVYQLSSEDQCLLAAIVCCLGSVLALRLPVLKESMLAEGDEPEPKVSVLYTTCGMAMVTLLFLGLIWLDSAAFYIMQSSEALKSVSWGTNQQLWTNACVHFFIALCGGLILDRGWIFSYLLGAFALLETGAWLLGNGARLPAFATILYVSGVSLYSTALVSYGALSPQLKANWRIASRAGIVFAVGGWFGSAMGIGMAKDLNRIPGSFLLVALIVAVGSVLAKWRLGLNRKVASTLS